MSNVSISDWRVWARADTAPGDTVVQAAINAAEELVGDLTARYFTVATGTESTRTYVPTPGDPVLRIHDCVGVTVVTDDGATLTAGVDYQLEPVGANWSGTARPYTQIRRLGGTLWTLDDGKATASVDGDWGWTALPGRYTLAVKMLVDASISEFNSTGVLAPPKVTAEIAEWLVSLRRVESWGIA